MKIVTTPIAGVWIVKTTPFVDQRGYLYRGFCNQELEPILKDRSISQVNVSKTEDVGAIRGIHFQYPPYSEMKFIRCIRGRIWDVAVDLRQGSATFLQWFYAELSADNGDMIVIPEGCGHGFQVLEPNTEMLYLNTSPYEPNHQSGLLYNDPLLNISWPIDVTTISERDQSHPLLSENFQGLLL
ncbi:dTDP-4-dehydrorhamnose 3,5-epimerase family protein [Cylindrospermopsis raciborskii]|uniref:dTDP-4-dehydrorhamnose 3,5-epimerase family protein n=1 Tax=Cylindrospermopsis raciborskii TaxID=77022 RepID=UPI0008DD527F|nr:dTDP-4-dehydrorhamnose 3,5-epimerase family protein [Cylindrospermopsis raciborskii]NLQ05635.1 dTDP-4-keto-6-deoxy-D-glucose epimerase [Cylindrospermopsis raciborskii MVCC19]OHY34209.1 dTDP-4-dehydrorhamnose 3,5-epimerase [Cylindrospermopsis raciborskii MVCC14]